MGKKTKKEKAGKKAAAKRPGRKLDKGETTYTPEMAVRVREIILEIKPLKDNGSLNLGQVARVMGIPQRTFSYWTDPNSEYFKYEFFKALTAAHEELCELIDLNKTQKAMISRSQPYTRKRITKELRKRGPDMPALSKMKKPAMQRFAKRIGVVFTKKMTVPALTELIKDKIESNTVEELVIVKEETERMHGDVAAARLVVSNIGPKDKRWTDKSEVNLQVNSLADIAAIMSGKQKAG